MLLRRLGVLTVALAALSVPVTAASAASAPAPGPAAPVLAVSGTVAHPVSYTLSQLRALPTETVTVPGPDGRHGVQVTGISLDHLVTIASPVLPAAKNALLRVIVTAGGPHGRQVSFALGELDPGFGNHD